MMTFIHEQQKFVMDLIMTVIMRWMRMHYLNIYFLIVMVMDMERLQENCMQHLLCDEYIPVRSRLRNLYDVGELMHNNSLVMEIQE